MPNSLEQVGQIQIPKPEQHYRPDIDGLRAIAIIAVVAYHAFPEWIHAGFVGVDIFFVISGYLITGVIYRHLLDNNFSLSDFYQRRIRRIFPALLLVTVVTFVVGWFILAPQAFQSLGSNIAGGALFIQNLVLLQQIGYFDIEASKKPLLHLWSLGVEEQYYIAWPLILWLCQRKRINAVFLTVVLIVLSFSAGLAAYAKDPDIAFYLPVTRAWELLIGSTISIVELSPKAPERRSKAVLEKLARAMDWRLVQETLAILAVGAILFVIFRHKPFAPYPGSASVLSVTGSALLIVTPGATINRRILSSRFMVFIGLISYPLYLWHFPLMAFVHIRSDAAVAPSTMTLTIALSVALAWLTYQFVEKPIRYGKTHVRTKVIALLSGLTATGAAGLLVVVLQGVPSRVPENLRAFLVTKEQTNSHWRLGRCMLYPTQGASGFSDCDNAGPRPRILIWGDSYAAALYPGLKYVSDRDAFGLSQYTAAACPPLLGYVSQTLPYCKEINDFVATRIGAVQPDIVILHSKWFPYDNEGAVEKGLEASVARLKDLNIKRIVLLGPMPSWLGDSLPEDVLDYYYQTKTVLPERTEFRLMKTPPRNLEPRLRELAKKLGIEFIAPQDILCDASGCLTRIGESGSGLISYDAGHLTVPGSIFMAEHLHSLLLGTSAAATAP